MNYQQVIQSFRRDFDPKLYEMFLTKVRTFIHNLLVAKISNPTDREELTQEILIAVHKSLHTYDHTRPFTPWFYSVVRFKTIDFWRMKTKDKTQSLENSPELTVNTTYSAELAMLATEVIQKMNELPPVQREILYLAKVKGLTMAEISQQVGKKESAVKVTIHRVLKNMRKKLL